MGAVTVKRENLIQRVLESYVEDPLLSMADRAKQFNCSASYMASIINSDNFKSKLQQLNEGREETVLQLGFGERIQGVQIRALEVLEAKLEETQSAELALKIIDATAGLGVDTGKGGNTGVMFQVNLAPKSASPEEWETQYAAGTL